MHLIDVCIIVFMAFSNILIFKKLYLVLEILTEAYRHACSEGEVTMYRAHVVVLGDSKAFNRHFIDRPRYPYTEIDRPSYPYIEIDRPSYPYTEIDQPSYPYTGGTGIKTRQIKSKFNKSTQKTEVWKESVSNSSDLKTKFTNAVLSHIRSIQHGSQAKGVMETLQQSHLSSADSVGKKSSVSTSESNKTGKQAVRQNITYKCQAHEKEFAVQFQNPDNKTLFFLHRNAQIKETPDNNIPYSFNLWEFDDLDEFSVVHHSFLNTEALILYVMDISLHLFSPLKRNTDERNTNENSKTPAELLRYWLNLVDSKAKKQNLKPNIVFLLTHKDSKFAGEHNQYLENYIKAILDMVEGKPYATYITKENIISCDWRQQNFEDITTKLFHRITTQSSWGVKKPIRWLYLEADLLNRAYKERTYKEKSFSQRRELFESGERTLCLLVSEVKDIASAYNMDDCDVESFLEFHHILGDLICCTLSSGERRIITNPGWLLNKFEGVLDKHWHWHDMYTSQSHSLGIISTEGLSYIWEGYDVEFFIDLMISFDVILPLDNEKQKYLVPGRLPPEDTSIHESELTYRAVYKADIDDPRRTFRRLLSSCARESNWKLNIGSHLRSNNASFQVTKGTHLAITQIKDTDTLQINTWTSKQELDKKLVSDDEILAVLFDIHKEIARKMKVLDVEPCKSFRMICPHWRPGDEYVCLVEIEEKPEPQTDNFAFYPKFEKCAIHNKALQPSLFFMTGEHRKGMFND